MYGPVWVMCSSAWVICGPVCVMCGPVWVMCGPAKYTYAHKHKTCAEQVIKTKSQTHRYMTAKQTHRQESALHCDSSNTHTRINVITSLSVIIHVL